MNDIYCESGEQEIFRVPVESWEEFNKALMLSDDETSIFLSELCDSTFFLETIFIASRSLYSDLLKFKDGKISDKDKLNEIKISVLQYYYRMCSRTTPFGLFAAIALENKKSHIQKRIKRTLWLDYEWCWKFSKRIENQFLNFLSFQLNGMCFESTEKYSVPFSISENCNEIKKNLIVNSIVQACKKPISFYSLKNELCCIREIVSEESLIDNLKKLLSIGIIVSNVTPSPNEHDYLGLLLDVIGNDFTHSKQGKTIQRIRKYISEYEQDIVKDSEKVLGEIISELESLIHSERYVQVDATFVDGISYSVSKEDKETICEAVSIMYDFVSKIKVTHTIYDTYKDLFLEKYGDYKIVPLLEMLDPIKGIGVPNTYKTYTKKTRGEKEYHVQYNSKLVKYAYHRILKAINDKTYLEINDEFLDILSKIKQSSSKFPQKVYTGVFCTKDNSGNPVFAFNMDLLPTNGDFLPVQRLYDFQRSKIKEHSKGKIDEEETTALCQLQYVPKRLKWANVMRESLATRLHIQGYLWDERPSQNINLADICVGINNDCFFLCDRKSQHRINVITNNMYSFHNDADVIRFLKEVGEDNTVQVKHKLLDSYFLLHNYLPEVRYKNVVVIPETWRFTETDFWGNLQNYEDFKEWYLSIIKKYSIPEYVYYSVGDFGYFINTNQDIASKMIYKNWKKHRNITFQNYPGCMVNSLFNDNRSYRLEMLMSFMLKGDKEFKSSCQNLCFYNNQDNERYYSPGSEWIYVKLFGIEEENQLLKHVIIPWCNQQIASGNAIKFYYLRYKDISYQIRLRIQQTDSRNLFISMLNWLNSLVGNSILFFEVSTYERELERYGGLSGIEYAEKIFYYDSLICGDNVSKCFTEKREIYLLLAQKYIEEMYPCMEERMQWIINNSPNKEEYKRSVIEYKNTLDNTIIGKLIEKHSVAIDELTNTLKKYSAYFNDNVLKSRALDGIIHVSFNRMFGMKRLLEKEMRAILRYKIYQHFQKHKHINNNADSRFLYYG